jgi:IS5 family transposase
LAARDWKRINDGLVRRGEILLDLRILDRWDSELEEMNAGKEGGRYVYPDIFAKLLGYMHVLFHLPYRQTEGFLKALRRFDPRIRAPDYSTIDRRVNRLDVKLDEKNYGDDLILAVDASGIKVSNRGDWMRREWKQRRGYLKVHIAVDTKRKRILALQVTDDRVGDERIFQPLIEEAGRKVGIKAVMGDGAYDTKSNFTYLTAKHIEPIIKVHRNASTKAYGCVPRKLVAQEYLRNPEAWKRRHHYGRRWIVESTFSSLKRTFGEYVSAKTMRNMANELMLKASLYNLLTPLTQTPQRNPKQSRPATKPIDT